MLITESSQLICKRQSKPKYPSERMSEVNPTLRVYDTIHHFHRNTLWLTMTYYNYTNRVAFELWMSFVHKQQPIVRTTNFTN